MIPLLADAARWLLTFVVIGAIFCAAVFGAVVGLAKALHGFNARGIKHARAP
jgi:type III secretory pathway component EscS